MTEPAPVSSAICGLTERKVIDGLPRAVIVTDPEGLVVLWNAAAERLSGWPEQAALGRPIVDFLIPRGEGDPRHNAEPGPIVGPTGDHRLIRKGGGSLDVHVSAQPLLGAAGEAMAMVWVSADTRELTAAQVALEEASQSLRMALAGETRRALLAEATSDLAVSLSVTDSLQRLARLVIPDLADWVIIDLADEQAKPHQVAMLHRDGCHETIERFSVLQPTVMTEHAPILQVLRSGLPILHSETSIDVAGSFVVHQELLELCDRLGICSVMYVPMVARGRTLGCLTLVAGVSGRHYDQRDLEFAMGLAQRAALVVDNSSLYEREHRMANVLQESLLPTVPEVPGLDIAARYRPSDIYAQVGGDFYDVLPLPDGTVALMVGDVIGHDLVAAATMGQLRGHLRACAWEGAVAGGHDPGAVLDRTDRLIRGLRLTDLATVLYGTVERHPDLERRWTFTYATAGHPAPLLRLPDGRVRELEGKGMAMGVSSAARRPAQCAAIPEGSVLVSFTDGMVERRTRDWAEGLETVRQAFEGAPGDISTTRLADSLLDAVDDERFDDTVVLVVRFA